MEVRDPVSGNILVFSDTLPPWAVSSDDKPHEPWTGRITLIVGKKGSSGGGGADGPQTALSSPATPEQEREKGPGSHHVQERQAVRDLLVSSRVPFTETASGGFTVMGSVIVDPPYFADSAVTGTNKVMVDRVRAILKSRAATSS
jgi:hypothetical protein